MISAGCNNCNGSNRNSGATEELQCLQWRRAGTKIKGTIKQYRVPHKNAEEIEEGNEENAAISSFCRGGKSKIIAAQHGLKKHENTLSMTHWSLRRTLISTMPSTICLATNSQLSWTVAEAQKTRSPHSES